MIIIVFCYINSVEIHGSRNSSGQEIRVLVPRAEYTGHHVKLGEHRHHVFAYKIFSAKQNVYRAFCAGNIITTERVLSSAHCYLTNRKRYRRPLKTISIVAGVLTTSVIRSDVNYVQQWKQIQHIYSQSYFRFPAYNLAILKMESPFTFNQFVKSIPYASMYQDFDGVCTATTVRASASWAASKSIFTEHVRVLTRSVCELELLIGCRLYLCTKYTTSSAMAKETEGGGLICYNTNDPKEVNTQEGILVGVTAVVNLKLPSLHSRIGLFRRWVDDEAVRIKCDVICIMICLICVLAQ